MRPGTLPSAHGYERGLIASSSILGSASKSPPVSISGKYIVYVAKRRLNVRSFCRIGPPCPACLGLKAAVPGSGESGDAEEGDSDWVEDEDHDDAYYEAQSEEPRPSQIRVVRRRLATRLPT
jgi:hypothetical protein